MSQNRKLIEMPKASRSAHIDRAAQQRARGATLVARLLAAEAVNIIMPLSSAKDWRRSKGKVTGASNHLYGRLDKLDDRADAVTTGEFCQMSALASPRTFVAMLTGQIAAKAART